jgi:hypothetical protein
MLRRLGFGARAIGGLAECRAHARLCPEEEDKTDMRAGAVSVREEGAAYRFGIWELTGRGQNGVWAGMVPSACFLFFISFSFFF